MSLDDILNQINRPDDGSEWLPRLDQQSIYEGMQNCLKVAFTMHQLDESNFYIDKIDTNMFSVQVRIPEKYLTQSLIDDLGNHEVYEFVILPKEQTMIIESRNGKYRLGEYSDTLQTFFYDPEMNDGAQPNK
jgi:hypothetical protein